MQVIRSVAMISEDTLPSVPRYSQGVWRQAQLVQQQNKPCDDSHSLEQVEQPISMDTSLRQTLSMSLLPVAHAGTIENKQAEFCCCSS